MLLRQEVTIKRDKQVKAVKLKLAGQKIKAVLTDLNGKILPLPYLVFKGEKYFIQAEMKEEKSETETGINHSGDPAGPD